MKKYLSALVFGASLLFVTTTASAATTPQKIWEQPPWVETPVPVQTTVS